MIRILLAALLGFAWLCAFVGTATGMLEGANSIDKYAATCVLLALLIAAAVIGTTVFTRWEEKR